jgi:hypothetical protein
MVRTDVSYGHAVGLPKPTHQKWKHGPESTGDMTKKRYKCGSEDHQRTTHKDCPLNPKKNTMTGFTAGNVNTPTVRLETENTDSASVSSRQKIQNMVSDMCLIQNHEISSDSDMENS